MNLRSRPQVIALAIFLLSCEARYEERNPLNYYPISEDRQQELLNSPDLALEDKLGQAKTLFDNTYPIEIILFENQSFYYFMANLGNGWGEWLATDGAIELKAKAELFVMMFLLKSIDPAGQSLELIFEDRNRLNRLSMEFKNFP